MLFELDFVDRRWRILTRAQAAQVLREALVERTWLREGGHVYTILGRRAAATLRPVA